MLPALNVLIGLLKELGLNPNLVGGILVVMLGTGLLLWTGKQVNIGGLVSGRRRRKDDARAMLEAYVARGGIDTLTQEAVRERLEIQYFYEAFKIYAELPLRNQLIELHKASAGQLGWREIRRAVPHLVAGPQFVALKPQDLHDRITRVYVHLTQVFCSLLIFFCVAMLMVGGPFSLGDGSLWTMIIVVSGVWILVASSALWPYADAKKIKKILDGYAGLREGPECQCQRKGQQEDPVRVLNPVTQD